MRSCEIARRRYQRVSYSQELYCPTIRFISYILRFIITKFPIFNTTTTTDYELTKNIWVRNLCNLVET